MTGKLQYILKEWYIDFTTEVLHMWGEKKITLNKQQVSGH